MAAYDLSPLTSATWTYWSSTRSQAMSPGPVGSRTQYDAQPAASKREALQRQVDASGAERQHLDREQRCDRKVALGEVGASRDQQIRLHDRVIGERDVERREQHLQVGRTVAIQ